MGSIPGAQMVVIEDAGHAPYMNRPDDFNATIVDFIGTLAG